MDSFNDKSLNCVECGGEFTFTRNEQSFYAERGFTNEPKRCKNCRDKRKNMRGDGGNGSSRERSMVSVTCDGCGITTEVPFTPVSGKPVYCRDCYNQRRSHGRANSYA